MAGEFSTANHLPQAMLTIPTVSIANDMTPSESEGASLARRLEGVNKRQFALTHKIPGGPSMLSQNISGTRPISLEAGIAYARAFGCSLEEISPRLGATVRAALSVDLGNAQPQPPTLRAALQTVADSAESAPLESRLAALELLTLVVKDPAAHAADLIPIIERRLLGESSGKTGTYDPK